MKLIDRIRETRSPLSEEDDGETTGEYENAREELLEAFKKGDEKRARLRTRTGKVPEFRVAAEEG